MNIAQLKYTMNEEYSYVKITKSKVNTLKTGYLALILV